MAHSSRDPCDLDARERDRVRGIVVRALKVLTGARPATGAGDLRYRSRRPQGAGNVSRQGKGWCRVDRCALFVDAGYALADGALAVHGTRNRDSVSWDYAGLLKLLGGLSRDRTGLPLLRCYWYDTSTDGNRAPEHYVLADLPLVKLRLR